MKVTLYAEHTAPGGEIPYEAIRVFEILLINEWGAVVRLEATSIDRLDVTLRDRLVGNQTVNEVKSRLQRAVTTAQARSVTWRTLSIRLLEPVENRSERKEDYGQNC